MENYKSKIVERVEELQKEKPDYPLTINEAAEYLRVSQANLYRLTSHKLIPFYKPAGKLIYFFKRELNEWIVRGSGNLKRETEDAAFSKMRDPNQLEMELNDIGDRKIKEELVIEFPLKRRRKKLADFSSQKSENMRG